MGDFELKICPFCGKEAVLRHIVKGHNGFGVYHNSVFAGCDACGVGFTGESKFRNVDGIGTVELDGFKEVVEAWNRRAL